MSRDVVATTLTPPPGAWFRKFSEVSYAVIPDDPKKLAEWQAKNCEKLAEIMAGVPEERHDQCTWLDGELLGFKRCGSAQCALGWAVVSGKFRGLQWSYCAGDLGETYMVVNGKRADEYEVGEAFFGRYAYSDIFSCGHLSKETVINRLKEAARMLRRSPAD